MRRLLRAFLAMAGCVVGCGVAIFADRVIYIGWGEAKSSLSNTPFPTMLVCLLLLWWFFWAMIGSIGDDLREDE